MDRTYSWRKPLTNTATVGSGSVLKIAYYGAALAFCCVTMAANLNFGMTLGSTLEEKLIYATASVAADIVKSTWMMVVIQLWQARRYGRACIASALWMACLLWSLASATGFALATQRSHGCRACRRSPVSRRLDRNRAPGRGTA